MVKIFRQIVLPAAGAIAGGILGGPAGAVAGAGLGHSVGQAAQDSSDAKKFQKEAANTQKEGLIQSDRYRASLDKQLANDAGKVNSAIARANRGRVRGGLFGGEVSETPKGPTATLG